MTGLAVRTFLTMLVILDPIGVVPMFLALAGDREPRERRRIARRAVLVAGGILVSFALGGAWLLGRLGITLHAFRIAGGVLLFLFAMRMVLARHERETREEADEARGREDVSVFPLAIPIIAGPGAIASVLILAGEARAIPFGVPIVLLMTAIVLVLCLMALEMSDLVGRLLGQTGTNVVTRVLGVLLAALAVQYIADGVRGLLSGAA
ncbi:MAG: MarC family protein [Candidatus Polarisedimenticolia bacterium]